MTDRVRLNLRVSSAVKEQFERAVSETYGETSPHAGIELERHLLTYLDIGPLADLLDATVDLADRLDVDPREKNSPSRPERTDSTVVRYAIAEGVRDRVVSYADREDFRSPGEVIESIMWRYVCQGSHVERVTDCLEHLADAIETEQESDDLSTAEAIVRRLDAPFTRGEFLEAAEAEGVGTTEYALKQYLPKVLDAASVVPHPGNNDLFVPEDASSAPDVVDPAALPYHAMDDQDKRLAIKAAAIRRLRSTTRKGATYSVKDAVAHLDGRPNPSTVRGLMSDLDAESENGFRFDSDDDALRVNRTALAADWTNETALRIVGYLDDTSGTDGTDDNSAAEGSSRSDDAGDTPLEWVDRAVESVAALDPHLEVVRRPVLQTIVAKAKHPDRVGDGGGYLGDPAADVTEADLARAAGAAALEDTGDGYRRPTTDPPDEPDSSPIRSTTDSAPVVATDGGQDDPDTARSRIDELAAAPPSHAD